MSQATPMTTERRWGIYSRNRRGSVTDRQGRQMDRMADRAYYRKAGVLPHGATGERIRRPVVRVALPPERGSFRTHIAAYCAPCPVHVRPRLHRIAQPTT